MTILPYNGMAPVIHPTAFCAPGAFVIGNVTVGREAGIWYNCVVRGDVNRIVIGDRANIQDLTMIHVTHELEAVVGDDVTVGHRAVIHGCVLEEACLIGMGSVILDGARIGRHALVAAGSVVRQGFTVPEGVLAAGVPAKVIRPLEAEEIEAIRASAVHYAGYAAEHLRSLAGVHR